MTLITYQEVEQQIHCCSLWSLWHRSLEAGLKIYKLNKTLIVYGKTTFCHRNKKVIIEPFLYFSYKSRGAIFLRWSRTIVIRLELNWLCRQREGSVHPERLRSWEIIFKWPVAMEHIQISVWEGKELSPYLGASSRSCFSPQSSCCLWWCHSFQAYF